MLKVIKKCKYVFAGIIFIIAFLGIMGITELKSNASLDTNFNRALIVFGVSKAIDGIISLLQGSRTSFSAIVGFDIAIGEVLDPINDLIERFSFIMLLSLVSLGVQKIIYKILYSFAFKAIVVSLLSLSILLFYLKQKWLFCVVSKISLIFVFASLTFVSFTYIDIALDKYLLNATYQDNIATLENQKDTLNKQGDIFKNSLKAAKSVNKFIDKLLEYGNDMLSTIVNLSVVFVIKTILLPLLFFYILYIGVNYILRIKVSKLIL